MNNVLKGATALACTIMVIGLTGVTAYAGTWEKNETGYWYDNGGSFPVNTWQWIDGNGDGVAECYYFDTTGYMLSNTNTPDGYLVNVSGAWTVNGIIQTQSTHIQPSDGEVESDKTSGYNADGINNIAIDLINSTREEANTKYGPESVNEYFATPTLSYSNGFKVNWSIKKNHEAGYQADPSNMDNYYIMYVGCSKRTDMVNFLTDSDNDKLPEDLIKILKNRGYDAVGNNAYCSVLIEDYEIQFYKNGNVQLSVR